MNEAATHPPGGGINEAFPYRVCINLDRRPDRWRQMQLKFARHGIHTVRRFRALDGDELEPPAHWRHTKGAYGCLRSHLEVVTEARRRAAPSVFIFEDDVVFDEHLQQKFSAYLGQLPADWDMLYLGALHKDEPIRVSANLARITEANSTYAYALRDTVFDAFIELNRQAETVLDLNSLVLQRRFNCYCFMPHLAWVEDDYSDAQNRLERHWYLQESLVLFSPRVDSLLRDATLVLAHDGGARDAENLLYLVNYYQEFFSPHLALVVVEQGARPALDPAALPDGCGHVFLPDAGPFNRGRCFNAGARRADPGRRLVILSDSDIYLETLDFRANLRMCERFDCVTGFTDLIDLNGEDSLRLRRTKTTRGMRLTRNASQSNRARPGYCYFLRREALQALGGWDEGGAEQAEPFHTPAAARRLRVFQSPNHALRLRQDR